MRDTMSVYNRTIPIYQCSSVVQNWLKAYELIENNECDPQRVQI